MVARVWRCPQRTKSCVANRPNKQLLVSTIVTCVETQVVVNKASLNAILIAASHEKKGTAIRPFAESATRSPNELGIARRCSIEPGTSPVTSRRIDQCDKWQHAGTFGSWPTRRRPLCPPHPPPVTSFNFRFGWFCACACVRKDTVYSVLTSPTFSFPFSILPSSSKN